MNTHIYLRINIPDNSKILQEASVMRIGIMMCLVNICFNDFKLSNPMTVGDRGIVCVPQELE